MAWRGLHISRETRLSLADNQLVARQDETEARLPIEDIAWIVLDSPRVTLSTALLSACMAGGIAIICTDRTHTPSGVLLPFHQHYRQAEIARLQVGISAPLKKRLWQPLVQAKIENQAASLLACGQNATVLRAMIHLVGSGDPDNIEARAARVYWPQLFMDFVREDGTDKRNALLNYGYAVIRSAVARGLVATGLLPAFGLHHASVTNAFNLADDIVEPFRPFVDRQVWQLTRGDTDKRGETTVEQRQKLASILTEPATLADEQVSLLTATETVAESLVRAMQGANPALLRLPRMA